MYQNLHIFVHILTHQFSRNLSWRGNDRKAWIIYQDVHQSIANNSKTLEFYPINSTLAK